MTATLLMLGVKSLLVAALTLGILRLARQRSAAERSTIAHLGLFALVALPLASLLLPPLSVSLPEAIAPVSAPAPIILPAEPLPPMIADQAPVEPQATQSAAPLDTSPSLSERAAVLAPYASLLARYAYALPALALALLTLVALARLVALRSRAQVLIDPHWLNALGRAQHRMGFKSGTALLTSTELRSPISWGLMRPTIVINESALEASEQAEAIIAHELAHVIQLDWAKLMLARIATAVFWFNPLAWVLAREAHQLREEAADDAVLAANITGTDYAQLLVGIARHENHGLLLGAHGVAPGKNSLRRRVARVLDKTPARGPSGRSWVAGFTAGMMVMAAPLAAVTFSAAAKEKAAPAAPEAAEAAPPPAHSWSTRAGEGPNQISTQSPHLYRSHRAELADAVNGLHVDDATPGWAGAPDAPERPDPALVPGTPDYSAAWDKWGAQWEKYGAAMGERMSRAFTRVTPQPRPQPNFDFNFNFDFQGPAFNGPNHGKKYSESEIDANLGIPETYRKEIADAGFPNASRGELARASGVGVTGEYIADMRKAGINGSLSSYAQARAVGLNAAYIESLQDAGISGSLADYIKARNMGVNGAYVRALKDAGVNGTIDDFVRARMFGLSSGYIRAMNSVGVKGSIEEYQQMLNLGINSGYVAALHRNGTMITEPRRLIELKTRGWRSSDRDGNDDP